MRIMRGFTIIELLVVMGIIAILAVIAAPNFVTMQNRVRFKEDVQKFQDLLGEARSNALSNKKCGNGENSMKWSVYLREEGRDFKLYCQGSSGDSEEQINESSFTLSHVSNIELIESETANGGDSDWYGFANHDQGFVLISYISGTGQAKIESFGDDDNLIGAGLNMPEDNLGDLNGNRQKDIRIVFVWERSAGNERIIVCMKGIAGFSRKDLGDAGLANCPNN